MRRAHRSRGVATRESDAEYNKSNHTYLTTTNYWAPLHDNTEDEEQAEQINLIAAEQSIANTKANKWAHRIERSWAMKLVIDSGATSNFVPEEMNLPKKGKSYKEVYLQDNSKLQASYKTELPFEKLSEKAIEADC